MTSVDDPLEIDGDDPIPVLERGVEKAAAEADARVVDEHVDRLGPCMDLVSELPHAHGVGHVDDLGHDLAPARAQLCRHARERRLLDVADHQVRSTAGKGKRRGAADPAPGAGDEDRLGRQVRDVHAARRLIGASGSRAAPRHAGPGGRPGSGESNASACARSTGPQPRRR